MSMILNLLWILMWMQILEIYVEIDGHASIKCDDGGLLGTVFSSKLKDWNNKYIHTIRIEQLQCEYGLGITITYIGKTPILFKYNSTFYMC